jgi:hypothetical protein
LAAGFIAVPPNSIMFGFLKRKKAASPKVEEADLKKKKK